MTINLTYGDSLNVDFAALPEVSQAALAQRGFTHVFGNEVASRVHSRAMGEDGANSDDKATVKAWKDANPDKLAAWAAEVSADFLAALNDGTLGNRVSGPRLTPVETIARQMARKEIEDILRANKIKVPTKDDKVKMPDGEFTMAELVTRRLEKFGDRINAAAKKEADRRAKQTDAVTANAAEALTAL
jgi:hypothetical protein